MRKQRTPLEDLLVGGLDDWIYASWVCVSAALTGVTERSALRELSLGMIAEALAGGLMVPGDISDGRHLPWDCTDGEAMMRITREWVNDWGDQDPTPGAIVWLANTTAGDRIAHGVLCREHGT